MIEEISSPCARLPPAARQLVRGVPDVRLSGLGIQRIPLHEFAPAVFGVEVKVHTDTLKPKQPPLVRVPKPVADLTENLAPGVRAGMPVAKPARDRVLENGKHEPSFSSPPHCGLLSSVKELVGKTL